MGDVVPCAPSSVKGFCVTVGRIGGELAIESAAETAARPTSFWTGLSAEIEAFLAMGQHPEHVALVGHVVGALASHPLQDALLERLAVRSAALAA